MPDFAGLIFRRLLRLLRSTSSLLVGRSQMIFNHLATCSSPDFHHLQDGTSDDLAKLSSHFAGASVVIRRLNQDLDSTA